MDTDVETLKRAFRIARQNGKPFFVFEGTRIPTSQGLSLINYLEEGERWERFKSALSRTAEGPSVSNKLMGAGAGMWAAGTLTGSPALAGVGTIAQLAGIAGNVGNTIKHYRDIKREDDFYNDLDQKFSGMGTVLKKRIERDFGTKLGSKPVQPDEPEPITFGKKTPVEKPVSRKPRRKKK